MTNPASEINADIVFKDISAKLTKELNKAASKGEASLTLTLDQKYYEQLLPAGLTMEQVQQVRATDATYLNGVNNVFTNAVENFVYKAYTPNGANVEFIKVTGLMGGDHITDNVYGLLNQETGTVDLGPVELAGVTYRNDAMMRRIVANDTNDRITTLIEQRYHEAMRTLVDDHQPQPEVESDVRD